MSPAAAISPTALSPTAAPADILFAGACDRANAEHLHDLARAMIRQAKMLKQSGSADDARALGARARALDLLGWSYLNSAEA